MSVYLSIFSKLKLGRLFLLISDGLLSFIRFIFSASSFVGSLFLITFLLQSSLAFLLPIPVVKSL